MRTIGVFQLEQKKYDTIDLKQEFQPTFGRIPKNVHITIYGDSGTGKTEFAIRYVKALCELELDVDWISYEQGHGFDLQQACIRNNMKEVAANFQLSDPDSDKPDDVSYFEDLENKVRKRGSADIFVIDTVQFTDFTIANFKTLLKKYKRKGFIWLSHKEPSGKLPKGIVAQDIARLGGITILVKDYIAEPGTSLKNSRYLVFIFHLTSRLVKK